VYQTSVRSRHGPCLPSSQADHAFRFDESAFSLARLPQFLKETAYKNPGDEPARRGPFESAFDTDLGLFQFLNQRPARLEAFNSFMEGQRRGRKAWYDNFPAENLVGTGEDKDVASVLMVDVGGGRGHELEDFRKRYPNMAGRLILEDLPETINDIARLDESIERIEYDFFTPQPVKGETARQTTIDLSALLIMESCAPKQVHALTTFVPSSMTGLIAPVCQSSAIQFRLWTPNILWC